MGRAIAFLYGLVSYVIFLLTLLYAIGFVGEMLVPKAINTGPPGPFLQSLLINVVLLGLFAVQHSVMARPAFKRAWTKIVPTSVERSTFVLVSSLLLVLLYWMWQPMPDVVWSVENATARMVLQVLFFIGWGILVIATFNIGHFELFGLDQVVRNFRGRDLARHAFKMPGLYKLVRHPIMLGFVIAFWSTPHMTVGHLVFSVATTGYIIIGILLEERDLMTFLGAEYAEYRRKVPMLIPFLKGK